MRTALLLLLLAASTGSALAANGGSPWELIVIDDTLVSPDGVRPFDVDGDGDLDLSSAGVGSGDVRVYLNPGPDGPVEAPWPFVDVTPAGGLPAGTEDAVMADIDGDGRADVVSASRALKLRVHFAPTIGDYTDPAGWVTVDFPDAVAGVREWLFSIVMDVNEDGHLDIIAAGRGLDGRIGWFESPGVNKRDLATWQFHEMGDVGQAMSLIEEDMDGDGDQDVLLSDKFSSVVDLRGARWLENPGPAGAQAAPWTNHFVGGRFTKMSFIDVADMDGDTDRDVAAAVKNSSSGPQLLWFERLDASGDSWLEHSIDVPLDVGDPKAIRVVDLDLDGHVDLVLSFELADDPLSGVVWLSYPNSVYDSAWIDHEISGPLGDKYDLIQLIDLDADGQLDVVTTEQAAGSGGLGVIWYRIPEPAAIVLQLTAIGGLGWMARWRSSRRSRVGSS